MWHSIGKQRRNKLQAFVGKIDMDKAYDRLSWSFIQKTLSHMGYDSKWIRWIMQCISTVECRIRVNDSMTEMVEMRNGLRQGDPLSPFIFITCANVLSKVINHRRQTGKLLGYTIKASKTRSSSSFNITHLMFADDLLLFGLVTKSELRSFSSAMKLYLRASGQKINQAKSTIYVHEDSITLADLRCLRKSWEVQVSDIRTDITYLGVPISHKNLTARNFVDVLQKLKSQLNGWKSRHLAFPARIALIKSILTAIPSYLFRSTRIPRSVLLEMDLISRNFLWGW